MLTGPHIGAAVRISKAVKSSGQPCRLSLAAGTQALRRSKEPYVDAIVRGQGELTLLELTQRISNGLGWYGIRGLSFKNSHGQIVHEPERPVADINALPAPAYHLADPGI
jgi:anaerobic magnesium-protoporphyrin IX monomethyl ester cyclase